MENEYPWRVGRKVGRTIYMQLGPEPADSDILIGMMDSEEIALEAVTSHNTERRYRYGRPHPFQALTQKICQHQKWLNDSIDAICALPEDHPIHRKTSPWTNF